MALSIQRYMSRDCSLVQLLNERSKKEDENKSKAITIENNGICLHESVIVEIMSWLPVKDVLRYKSVCKSWYAILSSHDFISKHLQNNYANYGGNNCLLAQYRYGFEDRLFVMLVNETPRVLAHEVLNLVPKRVSHMCGPCDGLYYVWFDRFGDRAIWNPAINELKILPPMITNPRTTYAQGESYGFGFDVLSRDYKVVIIKTHWGTMDEPLDYSMQSTFVYSLKNDSWKHCGDLHQYYEFESITCFNFCNGYCYWLTSTYSYDEGKGEGQLSKSIISFNFTINSFEEINLPNYKEPASMCLGIYDNSLAILSVRDIDEMFEIWTYSEGIWTMKRTMGPFRDVWKPLGYWEDNKIVLHNRDRKLVFVDMETQDVKDIGFENNMVEGIFVYKESLVSIKDVSCNITLHGPATETNQLDPVDVFLNRIVFGIQ